MAFGVVWAGKTEPKSSAAMAIFLSIGQCNLPISAKRGADIGRRWGDFGYRIHESLCLIPPIKTFDFRSR